MDHRRSSILDVNEWMRQADNLVKQIVNIVSANDPMNPSNAAFPQHDEEIRRGVLELGFKDVIHFCESFNAKFNVDASTGFVTLKKESVNLPAPLSAVEKAETVPAPTSGYTYSTSSSISMVQNANIDDETIALLANYNPVPPSLRSTSSWRMEEPVKVEPVKQTECIHFKYSHEGKTRRFAFPRDYSFLIGAVKDRVEHITGTKDLLLYWRDDESLIVLECGEDMQAAIDFAESQQKPPTCIFIETTGEVEKWKEETVVEVEKENDPTQPVPPKAVSPDECRDAFDGYAFMCDACDCYLAPSNGGRYKCIVCENYDLCKECVEKGIHSNHALVRLLSAETIIPLRDGNNGCKPVKLKEASRCSPRFEAESFEKHFDVMQIYDDIGKIQAIGAKERLEKQKLSEKPMDQRKICESIDQVQALATKEKREREKTAEELTEQRKLFEAIREVQRIEYEKRQQEKKAARLDEQKRRKRTTLEDKRANLEEKIQRVKKNHIQAELEKEMGKIAKSMEPTGKLRRMGYLYGSAEDDAVAWDQTEEEKEEERELAFALKESQRQARKEEKKRREEKRLDEERENMRRIDEEGEEKRRERAEKQWREMKKEFEPREERPPAYVEQEPVDFYDLVDRRESSTDSDLSMMRDEDVLPVSVYKTAAHTVVDPPPAATSANMELDDTVELAERSTRKERTPRLREGDIWSKKFLKDREDFLTGVEEIDEIPVHLERILLWELRYEFEEEALPEKLERFCTLVNRSSQIHVFEKPEKIFTGKTEPGRSLWLSRKCSSDGSDIEIIDMLREGSSSSLDRFDRMDDQFAQFLLQPQPTAPAAAAASVSATPATPVTTPAEPAVHAGFTEEESDQLESIFDSLVHLKFADLRDDPAEPEVAQQPTFFDELLPTAPAAALPLPKDDAFAAALEISRAYEAEVQQLRANTWLHVPPAVLQAPRDAQGPPAYSEHNLDTIKKIEMSERKRLAEKRREEKRKMDEERKKEDERQAKMEEATWRRLSRPLSTEEDALSTFNCAALGAADEADDDDSPFFSCSEEDPWREALAELQATAHVKRLRREKEEAKSISDDVKHIPVFMEYNILLELHELESDDEIQNRLNDYCSRVSKSSKKGMAFKDHKTIFSEHKDVETMIIKQIAADLTKRLVAMRKIVAYAMTSSRRRMIMNRLCELRAQIKEFKYNKVLFATVCTDLHSILLTNEYAASYNPMESLDRGWKYLYDQARGFVDTAKANAPALGNLLHPAQQKEQQQNQERKSSNSTSGNGSAPSWDPWEQEYPTEPTASKTPAPVEASAPVPQDTEVELIPLPAGAPLTDQQQFLLFKLCETGIFEDYDRMTEVCRTAKTLEQAIEMMLE